MTIESRTKSLHYVQLYAVRDWIDYSTYSNKPPSGEKNLYDVLLPSEEDYCKLKGKFATIVARVIAEHFKFFKEDCKGLIPYHLPHQYSAEMSTKSKVVRMLIG